MSTTSTSKAAVAMLALLGFLGLGFWGVAYGYQHNQLDLSGTGFDLVLQHLGFVPQKQAPLSASLKPTAEVATATVAPEQLPEEITISISSDPVSVEIYLDNAFVGETPKLLRYPKSDKEVLFLFRKKGFVEATQRVRLNQNQPLIVKLAENAQNKASVSKAVPTKPAVNLQPKAAVEENAVIENKNEKVRKSVLERLDSR